jgi:acyl-CoA thioesterase FadM
MLRTTVKPGRGDAAYDGHVNSAALASWFQNARSPILKIFASAHKIEHAAFPLIGSSTEYDYFDKIDSRFKLEIGSWISHIGVYSFTIFQEARQAGPGSRNALCVTCNAVLTYYDFEAKKFSPLPNDKKRRLEEFLIPKA